MKQSEKNYSSLDGLLSVTKPPIFWKEKTYGKKAINYLEFSRFKNNDTRN